MKLRTTKEERARRVGTLSNPPFSADAAADVNDLIDALVKEKRAHANSCDWCGHTITARKLRAEADELERQR